MNENEVFKYQRELNNGSAQEIIYWAFTHFGPANIALASSLGAEDQVIADLMFKINPQTQIFTLDTGRLSQETYEVIERTNEKYHFKIEMLFPDNKKVETLVNEYGPDLFYKSVENRRKCCYVRKVEPLKKKLTTLKAWVCGLRKEQGLTRSDVKQIEWDETFNLVKLNPLVNWTEEDVWQYIKNNNVPYNKLHDQGYPSIGCAPCTRAISPGEDIRAGRWWWEMPEHKECGLHIKAGKLIENNG
jgi:phosphoadenosine phosphosulfate reductase